IKVGFLYKPAKVTPIGATAALNSVGFVNGGDSGPRNRPALAQAFRENATGARVVVSANHLKSKGSACDAPDTGDGQGNCAIVRTNAANLLADWLSSDPTGTGTRSALIVGDLNSYAKEDPIAALEAKGYTNLVAAKIGPEAYSYVFDGQWGYLDHALGNAAIVPDVTGVAEWHVNADEPSVLDYNDDFKSAGQLTSLYAPDQFRVSDHDPVVVGLNLNAPPSVDAGGPYTVAEAGSVAVMAVGTDEDEDTLTYAWDLDNDGSFDDATGASAQFSAASIDGPAARAVRVEVSDGEYVAVDSATVNVTNVPPTATFNAPASVFAGFPIALSLTNATDVAPADRAGLTYAFDCGSGYGTFSTATTASCPTDAVGIRSVRGKVRDDDGDETEYRASVGVVVTFDSLCALVRVYVDVHDVANSLCEQLDAAEGKANRKEREAILKQFVNLVEAQSGKSLTATEATTLIRLAQAL
ncbi:MAG TPA: hypothetical protein VE487_12705, partial [Ilumatobacter sp.]|nr:hypothetical protein [Ilumatobacter sp.]